MNVSVESSIEEEDGVEKVERETLDTTIYQPDYVTEVNIKFSNIEEEIYLLCHSHSCSTTLTGKNARRRRWNWETGEIGIRFLSRG